MELTEEDVRRIAREEAEAVDEPGNDEVLLALRRFVVRVSAAKHVAPAELDAMTRAADIVLTYS